MARSLLNLAPFAAAAITGVLLLVLLVAGAREGVLDNYYLFKVETLDLKVPSKLSKSQILKDISLVSGSDLIGEDVTSADLNLAQYYTIHVFTCCAHRDSETTCTTPLVGSKFDPRKDLKLDNTGVQGTYSNALEDALDTYQRVNPFMGISFIIGFVFTLAAPTILLLVKRAPKAAPASVILSTLATILLLAACVSGYVTAQKLSRAMNGDFASLGIRSQLGLLLIPGWGAIFFSLLETIFLVFLARKAPARKMVLTGDLKGKSSSRTFVDDNSTPPYSPPQMSSAQTLNPLHSPLPNRGQIERRPTLERVTGARSQEAIVTSGSGSDGRGSASSNERPGSGEPPPPRQRLLTEGYNMHSTNTYPAVPRNYARGPSGYVRHTQQDGSPSRYEFDE